MAGEIVRLVRRRSRSCRRPRTGWEKVEDEDENDDEDDHCTPLPVALDFEFRLDRRLWTLDFERTNDAKVTRIVRLHVARAGE